MSVHRLRAITGQGTFAVDIEADRARLRSETEPQQGNAAPPSTGGPNAIETTFQITPIDANTLSVSVSTGIVAISTGAGSGNASDGRARSASASDNSVSNSSGGGAADVAATPLRAYVVADGDTTWVFIDGETFTIEVEPAERARPRRGSSGNEALAAPMPATVIKVLVEPGAEVHRGDVLLLLEAMKMELPVRAPRDGRVKVLHCRPGELVQPGTALVDLE